MQRKTIENQVTRKINQKKTQNIHNKEEVHVNRRIQEENMKIETFFKRKIQDITQIDTVADIFLVILATFELFELEIKNRHFILCLSKTNNPLIILSRQFVESKISSPHFISTKKRINI